MIHREYPPEGSSIKLDETFSGIRYSWTNQGPSSLGSIGVVAFLMFWMLGWAFGEIFVLWSLLTGQAPGPVSLFLVGWLGAWTIGGAFCAYTIYLAVRPPRPAELELTEGEIHYVTGTKRLALSFGQWSREERKSMLKGAKNKEYRIPMRECSNLRLERIGESLRLSVDWRSERIEIGDNLPEPDKEWLHGILGKLIPDSPRNSRHF